MPLYNRHEGPLHSAPIAHPSNSPASTVAMAFRFRLDEPIQKGFRRIGSEQIERALGELSAGVDLPAEIHEARKCLKRVRALLRLAREGLGAEVFATENRRFSNIAAQLAPARDDHVLSETLLKLEAAQDGEALRGILRRLRIALHAARSEASLVAADPAMLGPVTAELTEARDRFRQLSLKPATIATLIAGVERSYRRGRKALTAAYETDDDEAFHAWRKGVQAHWRHMSLLSRLWPALMDARVQAARELSQILGDDHDLSLLRVRIDALADNPLSASDTETVLGLVNERQDALRQVAKPRGHILFAASPKAHGEWLEALWSAAEAKARADKAAHKAGVIEPTALKKPDFPRT